MKRRQRKFVLAFGTRLSAGAAQLAFDLAVERQFRIFTAERSGTIWESRFVPPYDTPPGEHIMLCLILEGTIVWRMPALERYEGPVAFYATEEQLEGARNARSVTFRSWGNPFRLIEIRVPASTVPHFDGARPVSIRLSEQTWEVSGAYAGLARHPTSHEQRIKLARDLLRALQGDEVVAVDLASTILHDNGLRHRIWDAVTPFVNRRYFSPTLQELADAAALSVKQTTRHFDKFLQTYHIPGHWRAVTRRYRLRVAILLLSNPELSVVEVARATGYSSAEALSHALYADDLPSPTELRGRILAERCY